MSDKKVVVLLQNAYAAELETVANYLANSIWLDGLRAEEIKESLAEDVTEELGHAQKLAHRLKQLGACPPGSLALERTQKGLQPPADSTDILTVVKGVLAAENGAISLYKQIIKACDGKDYVTQDLAIELLADEEEHRCLFEGFLKSMEKHSAKA
jgi:bacterioferritin